MKAYKYTLRYSNFHGESHICNTDSSKAAWRKAKALQGDCHCSGCVSIFCNETGEVLSWHSLAINYDAWRR